MRTKKIDEAREKARFVESVKKGLEDADAGRFVSEKELDGIVEATINKSRKRRPSNGVKQT